MKKGKCILAFLFTAIFIAESLRMPVSASADFDSLEESTYLSEDSTMDGVLGHVEENLDDFAEEVVHDANAAQTESEVENSGADSRISGDSSENQGDAFVGEVGTVNTNESPVFEGQSDLEDTAGRQGAETDGLVELPAEEYVPEGDAEPTENDDFAEVIDPAENIDIDEQTDAAESAVPVENTDPAENTAPVENVDAAETTVPVENDATSEKADTAENVESAESANQTEAVNYAETAVSAEGEAALEEDREQTLNQIRAFQDRVKLWKYNDRIIIIYDSTEDIRLDYSVFSGVTGGLLSSGSLQWTEQGGFYSAMADFHADVITETSSDVPEESDEMNARSASSVEYAIEEGTESVPVRIVLDDGYHQYEQIISDRIGTVTAVDSDKKMEGSDDVVLQWNAVGADGYLIYAFSSEESGEIQVADTSDTSVALHVLTNTGSGCFVSAYSYDEQTGIKEFGESFVYRKEPAQEDESAADPVMNSEVTQKTPEVLEGILTNDNNREKAVAETENVIGGHTGSDSMDTGKDSDEKPAEEEKKKTVEKTTKNTTNEEKEILTSDGGEETASSEAVYGGVAGTYKPREYNGHLYQLFDEGVYWSTAKSRCEKKGGHLVTITSAGEHAFCKTILGSLKPKYCWTGASHVNGVWKWVTGEQWGYTAWSPTSPNGSGGGTHVEMQNWEGISNSWNWDDQGDSGTSPSAKYRGAPYYHTTKNYCYICEWDYRGKIASATVSNIKDRTYTGKAVTQSPKVVLNGRTLVEGTDYTLSYNNNIRIGTATVTITGTNGYRGSVSKSFKITKISIAKAKITGVGSRAYTGKKITQKPVVKLNNKKLSESAYTVSYSNNIKVGTATIIIKGKGNYTGTVKQTFRIGYSICKATISGIKDKTFTQAVKDKGATQSPVVKIGKTKLKKGTDYSISYKNNKEAGTATITISGEGKYIWSLSKSFKIRLAVPKVSLKSENHGEIACTAANVFGASGYQIKYKNLSSGEMAWAWITGSGSQTISLKNLKPGIQYQVQVQAYRNVEDERVWSTFSEPQKKKVYEGTDIKGFTLYFDDVKYDSANKKEYSFTNGEIKPSVKLKKMLTTLKEGKDFRVTFKNNIKVGTATAYIEGTGKYYGNLSGLFVIKHYPFIKENGTWYYRGGMFDSKTKTYDLDGPLIIEEPISVSSYEIKCKKLTAKMNVSFSDKASMTVEENSEFKLGLEMIEDSKFQCGGSCTAKSDFKLSDRAKVSIGKNMTFSNDGQILMEKQNTITVGGDLTFNPGSDSDKTALSEGTINVSGNVKIKQNKFSAEVGNRIAVKGSNKEHKISLSKGSVIGTLDLSDTDLYKLTFEDEGQVRYMEMARAAASAVPDIERLVKLTFQSPSAGSSISEEERRVVTGKIFEQLFLAKCKRLDLLEPFYSSAEGLSEFSSKSFNVPVYIPGKTTVGRLKGSIILSNNFPFGSIEYNNGSTKYTVALSTDISNINKDFNYFLEGLSESAVKEIMTYLYQEVFMDDFIAILSDGGFATDTKKIGFNLDVTKTAVDINDLLDQIEAVETFMKDKME